MAEIVAYVFRVPCPRCGAATEVRSDWDWTLCENRHSVHPPVVDRDEVTGLSGDPTVAALESIAESLRKLAFPDQWLIAEEIR